jgi:hypothetical protein
MKIDGAVVLEATEGAVRRNAPDFKLRGLAGLDAHTSQASQPVPLFQLVT